MYWCKKCKHQHKEDSKIGQKHKQYKFVGTTYYCSKCNHRHRISSKIGKNHFKYFREEKEKKEEKKEKEKETTEEQQTSLLNFKGKEREKGEVISEIPTFEGTEGKIEESYQVIPYLRSQIFTENKEGRLIIDKEKVKKVQKIKIEELPPFIGIREKDLIQKAKDIQKPVFVNKIVTLEGKTYFELELPTFDLVLYKEQ